MGGINSLDILVFKVLLCLTFSGHKLQIIVLEPDKMNGQHGKVAQRMISQLDCHNSIEDAHLHCCIISTYITNFGILDFADTALPLKQMAILSFRWVLFKTDTGEELGDEMIHQL